MKQPKCVKCGKFARQHAYTKFNGLCDLCFNDMIIREFIRDYPDKWYSIKSKKIEEYIQRGCTESEAEKLFMEIHRNAIAEILREGSEYLDPKIDLISMIQAAIIVGKEYEYFDLKKRTSKRARLKWNYLVGWKWPILSSKDCFVAVE